MSVVNLFAAAILLLPSYVRAQVYSNSSNTNGTAQACCSISGDAEAIVWWDEILTVPGPTMVYTVDNYTHSTVGSHVIYPNATTPYIGNYFTAVIDAQNASETLVQTNRIAISYEFGTTTTDTIDGYSTEYCQGTATEYSVVVTDYVFTTSIDGWTDYSSGFPTNDGNQYAYQYTQEGLLQVIESVASTVGYSCSAGGLGGIGSMKIGVSILTESSTIYANAQPVTVSPPETTSAPQPGNTITIQPPTNSETLPSVVTLSTLSHAPTASSVAQPTSSPSSIVVISSQKSPPGPPVIASPPFSSTFTLGTSTVTAIFVPSSTAVIIDGSTFSPGAPITTISGSVISVPAPNTAPAPFSSTFVLGTSTVTAVFVPSSSVFIIDSSTFSAGAPIATISGSVVALPSPAPTGIGGIIVSILTAPGDTPETEVLVGGHTTVIGGLTGISGGATSVIGGSTEVLSAFTSVLGGTTTFLGGETTVISGQVTVIGGSTSVTGGTTTEINGSETVIGGSTTVIGGTMETLAPYTTVIGGTESVIGGTTETLSGFTTVVGGSTSVIGGSTVVIGGSTIVIGGSTTVIGGSTSTLTSGTPGRLTTLAESSTTLTTAAPTTTSKSRGQVLRVQKWWIAGGPLLCSLCFTL